MKFKKRLETLRIYLVIKDLQDATMSTLYKKARRDGNFDTGYHFVLFNNGLMEADRPIDCVADCNFENSESSIYILVDSKGKLSDSQKLALRDFMKSYPDIETVKVEG